MEILSFTKKYVSGYKRIIQIFTISSLLMWVCQIIVPYITGVYLDALVTQKNMNSIYLFTGLILGTNILKILSQYIYAIYLTKLNNKTSFDINYDVIGTIRKMKLTDIKKTNTAYLMDRINQDVNNLTTFFSNNIISIFTNALTILLSLFIFLKIDAYILVFIIIIIPLYILLYKKFKNKLYTVNYNLADRTNYYFSKRTDQVNKLPFVKMNVLFEEMNTELKNAFDSLYKCILKQVKINYLFTNLSSIIVSLSFILIIFYGGIRVISGKLSIGNFTIINTYFQLIIASVTYYMQLAGSYQQAKVSKKRIEELLNVELESNGSIQADTLSQININGLNASFHQNQSLLNNIKLEFQKNKIYCLKGCNGIGKTTFINILLGLYNDIYEGNILYDSHNLKDLDMYYFRRFQASVVEQEYSLLNVSIKQYLTMGINETDSAYSKEMIHKYCNKFNILKIIEKLPEKFDTLIMEGGNTFSGGERQKLSIIRALLKKSQVMIFDEPTSALDTESINQFKNIMLEEKEGKIVVIISHDKRIFDICDCEIEF